MGLEVGRYLNMREKRRGNHKKRMVENFYCMVYPIKDECHGKEGLDSTLLGNVADPVGSPEDSNLKLSPFCGPVPSC